MNVIPKLRARANGPINAWFAGGPLHGTRVEIDIDQHTWQHRKQTEYYRVTEMVGNMPTAIFVARGLLPLEQRQLTDAVKEIAFAFYHENNSHTPIPGAAGSASSGSRSLPV